MYMTVHAVLQMCLFLPSPCLRSGAVWGFFKLILMSRDKSGIGRTGKKHNSKSKFDVNRRLKDGNMPS